MIRANSRQVSVQDGQAFLKDVWTLSPELRPDIYFAAQPRKGNTITFITDVDSISFKTEFGKTYDFIILLNGKDRCYTRISADYNGVFSPRRLTPAAAGAPDVIPFTLRGSRIYFEGIVNGNKGVAIQFDLGAGANCVNLHSVARAGVTFDGKITVTNTDGTHEEPRSSKNTLVIGDLKWQQVPLVQVRNMRRDEDLIVGNTLFEKKVVEIDYDRKVLLVRDRLDRPPSGHTGHDMILDQHRPKIQAAVTVAGKTVSDWFLFDTGRDGTMAIGDEFTREHDLWDKYKAVLALGKKKVVVLQEVKLGRLTFRDVVTNAVDPSRQTGRQSLLGNELLNHFNVILDNPNGTIYLKPNSLAGKTYSTYAAFKRAVLLWFGVVVGVVVALGGLVKQWRRIAGKPTVTATS